jgi:hypothetical protein
MQDIAVEILNIWMKEAFAAGDYDRFCRMEMLRQIISTKNN